MRDLLKYSMMRIIHKCVTFIHLLSMDFIVTKTFSKRSIQSTVLLALITMLCSCGSTTSPTTKMVEKNTPMAQVIQSNTLENTLQLADLAERQNKLQQRNQYLLKGAYIAVNNGQCAEAHILITSIFSELTDDNLARAKLYRVMCAHPNDDLLTQLSLLSSPTSEIAIAKQQWQLKANIFERLFNYPKAIEAHIKSQNYDIQHVWHLTQQLSNNELTLTGNKEIDGYYRLATLLREHALDQYELASVLTQYQFAYPNHPLVNNLPEEIIGLLQMDTQAFQQIAVLLPLSGRLSNQSQQIKQGILAAYLAAQSNTENTPTKQISIQFLDTNALDNTALLAKLTDIDVIIGPLLKPKLTFIAQNLRPGQQLLGLNRIDTLLTQNTANTEPKNLNSIIETNSDIVPEVADTTTTFFALAPEDEAIQIAQFMFAQQYQQPILIHAPDRTAIRMAEAFSETWQALSQESNLITLSFSDNKSMRKAIGDALGVQQSRDRITTLERYLGKEMFSVTRNRKDIDAFVVFANAEQTELINPMIEASISSFSDEFQPVFASSRSYNHQLNQNSLRDLQNVIFIDMPWLINSKVAPELLSQYETVFIDASATQKRLFAFGYDAYNLISKIMPMRQVKGLTLPGLTGNLTIDNNNQVTRVLPRAKITTKQIEQISGE